MRYSVKAVPTGIVLALVAEQVLEYFVDDIQAVV